MNTSMHYTMNTRLLCLVSSTARKLSINSHVMKWTIPKFNQVYIHKSLAFSSSSIRNISVACMQRQKEVGLENRKSDTVERNSRQSGHSQTREIWTVPNILCGVRIIASPFLSYCIIGDSYLMAVCILSVAGFTDLADGYIARNFEGQSSKLGTFLDPLADKVLIITLYTSMAYMNLIPGILMGLIVFRDVVLLAAGIYIRYISIPPPKTVKKYFDSSVSEAKLNPTLLSKFNTVLQLVTAIVSLYAPETEWITRDTLLIIWYSSGVSTILSGLSYIFSKNTFVISKNASKSSAN